MTHLLFLYFVLVYTLGLAALLFISHAYVRSRARPVLAFVVYYLAFTLKVVMSGAVIYGSANLADTAVRAALNRVDIWATLFLSCTIVYLMEHFTSFRRLRSVEWGFYAAALGLFVLNAFPAGFLSSSSPSYLLLAAVSLYSLVKSAFFLRAPDVRSRRFSIFMVAGLAVFIPLMFLPIFFDSFFRSLVGHAPLQLITFPLFYCVNGLLFARYFHKYYVQPAASGSSVLSLERGAYGLSDREMEVIGLVAVGDSNKAIGEKLFISVPTVKKHVHNAFAKMGLSTRYQLIHFLGKKPTPP